MLFLSLSASRFASPFNPQIEIPPICDVATITQHFHGRRREECFFLHFFACRSTLFVHNPPAPISRDESWAFFSSSFSRFYGYELRRRAFSGLRSTVCVISSPAPLSQTRAHHVRHVNILDLYFPQLGKGNAVTKPFAERRNLAPSASSSSSSRGDDFYATVARLPHPGFMGFGGVNSVTNGKEDVREEIAS